MKILNVLILPFLMTLVFSAHAQKSDDETEAARAVKSTQTQTMQVQKAKKSEMRLKAQPAMKGPDQIQAEPGTVLTLCCGSVNPNEMTGSNCAYMHTGQGCAGFILACPEGSKDTVTEDGSGYCKSGD